MSIPITEKLIQRQINHWSEFRKFLAPDQPRQTPPPPPVITISRQAGSGGRQLAAGICERLDLPLHDQSLVEQVMRQENLPPALVAEMDEQIASQTSLWIKGLFNRRIFLIKEYEHALTRTINVLAGSVGGIFLGRGAHLVLGDRADLRLRVVADTNHRQRRLQDRFELSRPEARALMAETDQVRADFLTKVFGQRTPDAQNFDLTVNTDRLGPTDLVDLVLLAWLNISQQKAAAPPLTAKLAT